MSGQVETSSGAYGTRQLSGKLSGGNERADFFVSASDFRTDGFNASKADVVLADDDGYENTTMHARIGVHATEALRLNAVVHDASADTEYDSCYDNATFALIHDCSANYEQQALRLSADLETAYGSHGVAWSTARTDREYFSDGQASFVSQGELRRMEYIGQYDAALNYRLVYGVDLEEEDNNGERRDQIGYYAEYLSTFSEDVFITAGLRRDDNDDFGQHTSYRVSGAKLIDLIGGQTMKLRGSYGTGFRAPSPYEASYNRGPFAYAPATNTSLSEETSKGYELAVELFTNSGAHFETVYFDQRIEDAIYFDQASFSGYLQDSGESRSKGLELSASMPLHAQLSLRANYTYNATQRPDGSRRQLRPRNLANLSLAWHSSDERMRLTSYLRRSAGTQDALAGAPVSMDAVNVFDVAGSYALHPQVQLYARLENVFDQDKEEILGYYSAGRAGYIGVRVSF